MIWVADPTVCPPRVGYAIGRTIGTATRRNRLRRRLRALVAQQAGTGQIPSGLYLVGARPAAAGCTFAQLASAVDQLFTTVRRRAGR
jgi:ribonuclease P protein component